MYTARQGLIAHLQTAQDEGALDVQTVKRYAGEMRQALEDPHALTVLMPAAFVIGTGGTRYPGDGTYDLDVILSTETVALDEEESADDAVRLGEALTHWLDDHPVYHQEADNGTPFSYQIDFDAGLDVETLAVTPSYSFVRVGMAVQESR